MMPRFTPPPPDVKLTDLERIVEYVDGCRAVEEKPQLELRRLKVRAMILFLFRTGVRVSELCALAAARRRSRRRRGEHLPRQGRQEPHRPLRRRDGRRR